MTRRFLLEVAVCTPEGAEVAQANGADRLELSSALEVGGVTPSSGLFREVREITSLPVWVLLRPRTGGFCYTAREFVVMCSDAETLLAEGAAGIVFGVLNKEEQIDCDRCRELVKLAKGRAVFHRAFDFLPGPLAALDELIALGFARVLTSGGSGTLQADSSRLARLVERAAGRIEVLAAGGIREHTVAELVRVSGCTQVHSAATAPAHSALHDGNPRLASAMGGRAETSGEAVRGLRRELDRLAGSLS